MTGTRRTQAKTQTPAAKARERLRALSTGLRRAAKHPAQADSIHRLRVAIRRFTQVLRVFGSGFEHTRRMRRRLRGLMDLCGAVRNCDIALEVLEAAGAPARPALNSSLKRRRMRAGRQLAKLLKDGTLRTHMRRWRGWLTAASGEQPSAPAPPPLLSREFLRSGAAAARAGADYAQMHEFRLLVKKLRYTLEILGSGGAEIAALRGLQERLGSINDCVTTADLISDMKLDPSEQRRIKAALNRLLASRSAEFRIYWRGNFGPKAARAGTPRSSA